MIWFEVLRVSRHAPNTSLIGNSALPGPYSRTLHRDLWWVLGGGGGFFMSEVPLYCPGTIHSPWALGRMRILKLQMEPRYTFKSVCRGRICWVEPPGPDSSPATGDETQLLVYLDTLCS